MRGERPGERGKSYLSLSSLLSSSSPHPHVPSHSLYLTLYSLKLSLYASPFLSRLSMGEEGIFGLFEGGLLEEEGGQDQLFEKREGER